MKFTYTLLAAALAVAVSSAPVADSSIQGDALDITSRAVKEPKEPKLAKDPKAKDPKVARSPGGFKEPKEPKLAKEPKEPKFAKDPKAKDPKAI